MSDDPKFTITYRVADGYAGGDRPKRVTAYLSDFEGCETDAQIAERVEELVFDHFRDNVFPEVDDEDEELAPRIREMLAGAK